MLALYVALQIYNRNKYKCINTCESHPRPLDVQRKNYFLYIIKYHKIFIIVGMNIIDLLAILPFYIELIQPTNNDNSTSLALDEIESNALFIPPSTSVSSATTTPPEEEVERVGGMDDVLQVFRIFKLARILKLAR